MLPAAALPVSAATADDSDKWQFNADIYLWMAGMDVTTQGGGEIDLSFGDILEDLEMTFMGGFGARKGKLSLLADVIYLDIAQKDGGTKTLPGGGIGVTFATDVEMKAWITTFEAGYNVVNTEKALLDIVGGARYLSVDVDTTMTRTIDGGPGVIPPAEKYFSASNDAWDGIVGVKGRVNLSEHWYLPYYADIGTGGSDLTWQILGGVGYQFKWGDVLAAYRHLDYDLPSDDLVSDLTVSGPALGVNFRF